MSSQNSGKVQTVLGLIEPRDLGPTSMHEHLLLDFTVVFQEPAAASEKARSLQPITIDNLAWVRYDPFRSFDNLRLLDEDAASAVALQFKRAGGGTIVDVTTVGIKRDPAALARIARATGLNVVMGAGYYIAACHPEGMDETTEDDLAREMVADVTVGVGDMGVKAGIIGELGCSWPLTDNERKVLVGAAQAQRETGVAITIHPGRDEAAPFEVLDILADADADIGRVVMGHLGRTYATVDPVLRLAERGCYLQYDQFGWESSYFSYGVMDFPNDGQRLDHVKTLVHAGYASRIVIGQDICTKTQLTKYGGYGYAHIVEHIPSRMRKKGISEADIHSIMVENPARVLTLA